MYSWGGGLQGGRYRGKDAVAAAGCAQTLIKTPNPKPQTPNPQPQTPNPRPSTLDPRPSTLNPQPSTNTGGKTEQIQQLRQRVSQLEAEAAQDARLIEESASVVQLLGRWVGYITRTHARTHALTHTRARAHTLGLGGLGSSV